MENLFLKFVDMSVTASWITLAVILLRLPLRKAPKWIMSLLWALVALRLVCPFTIESKLSLVPERQGLYESTVQEEVPVESDAQEVWVSEPIAPIIEPDLPEIEPVIPAEHEPSAFPQAPEAPKAPEAPEVPVGEQKSLLVHIFTVIWLCGVGLMLLYTLVSYLLLLSRVRESVRLEGNVRLCDSIPSPFILGIILPKIYLPSNLAQEDTEYVLSHERAHIKRGDHLWKPFGFMLLTVYWLNPIMWLAYVLMCRDIELACDERVIKTLGEDNKRSYSMALLRCSAPRRLISACPVAFGEVGVKERIKRVLNYKKPAFWVIIAALVATVVVAVCLMTNPIDITAGITLPKEIQITEAGLHGNKVELHAGENLVKLTDEQIKELKSHLSGLKTGRCVTEGAILYPCDIAVMTTAKGVPQMKKNRVEMIPHVYEIIYKSDGTVLISPPTEPYYEVDDKDFIEFIKSLKPETDEAWTDLTMTRLREEKDVYEIAVTGEKTDKLITTDSENAAVYYLGKEDFDGLNTYEELTAQTVTLTLSGVPTKVTIYRDKDRWLKNVESVYDVVGFKANDPKTIYADVIILSKLCAGGFRQYYSYSTSYQEGYGEEMSDCAVSSLIPEKAYGMTRQELSKKLGGIKWSDNGCPSPDYTKLAYISNKYVENGTPTLKMGVWIVDVKTGYESRLELPEGISVVSDTYVNWLDDETVAFTAVTNAETIDSYSMNITTGELRRLEMGVGIPYDTQVYGSENGVELRFDASALVISTVDIRSGKRVNFDIEKLGLYPSYWSMLYSSIFNGGERNIVGYLSDGRYALFGLSNNGRYSLGLSNNRGFGAIDLETEELRYFSWRDIDAPEYWQGKENIILNSYIEDGKLCGDGYCIEIEKLFNRGTARPPVSTLDISNMYNGLLSINSLDSDGALGDQSGGTVDINAVIPNGWKPPYTTGHLGLMFDKLADSDSTDESNKFINISYEAVLTDELDKKPQNYRSFFSWYTSDADNLYSDYYREIVDESFDNDGVFRYALHVHYDVKPEHRGEKGYKDSWDGYCYLADFPVYDSDGSVKDTCTLIIYSRMDRETTAELIKQMNIRLTCQKNSEVGSNYELTDLSDLDPKYAEQYDLVKGFMEKIGFYYNFSTLREHNFTKYSSEEKFLEYLKKYVEYLRLHSQLFPNSYGGYDITITDMEVDEHKYYQTVTLRFRYIRKADDSARGDTRAYFVLAKGESGLEIRDFVYKDNLPGRTGRTNKPPRDPVFWRDSEKYTPVLKGLDYNINRMRNSLAKMSSNPYTSLPYTVNDCYEIDPKYAAHYELIKSFMTDMGFYYNYKPGEEFDTSKYTSNEKFAEYLNKYVEGRNIKYELFPDVECGDVTITRMVVEDMGDYQVITFGFYCVLIHSDGENGGMATAAYFVTKKGENGVELLDFSDDPKAGGRNRQIPNDPDFWNNEEKYDAVLKAQEDNNSYLREKLAAQKIEELISTLLAADYSVHDVFSCKYIDEIGDIYCCTEIAGEEAVEKWTDEVYLKLPAEEQEGALYRCVHDLDITKEQLEAYAKKYKGTKMVIPQNVIDGIFSLSYKEFLQEFANPYALVTEDGIYTVQQVLGEPESVREAVGSEKLIEYAYTLKPLLMRQEGETAYEKYYKDKVEHIICGISDGDIKTCLDADLWFIDRLWYSDFEHDEENSFTEDGITYYRVTEPMFSDGWGKIQSYITKVYAYEMAAEMLSDPAIKMGKYYGWDALYCADTSAKKTDPRFTARTEGKVKPSNEYEYTFEWSYIDDDTSDASKVSVHAFFKTSDQSETVDEFYTLVREQNRWKIQKRGVNELTLD